MINDPRYDANVPPDRAAAGLKRWQVFYEASGETPIIIWAATPEQARAAAEAYADCPPLCPYCSRGLSTPHDYGAISAIAEDTAVEPN